nr:helix-turn-helix domain-containing protein [Clostridia bacterium]
RTFLILLTASATISTVVLCFLLARYFRPLKRLIQNTLQTLDPALPVRSNEFVLLDEAITTLSQQVHYYQSVVERDRPLLDIAVFMKWIIGSPVSEEDGRHCLESAFGTSGGCYRVAALRYDALKANDGDNPETLLIGIRDLCARLPQVYALIMEPTLLCFVLCTAAEEPPAQGIERFTALQRRIQSRYPVSVPLGIGGWVDRPEALQTSWTQAQRALGYRVLYPMQDIFTWEDAAAWDENDAWAHAPGLQRVAEAIQALDAPGLQAALHAYQLGMQQARISLNAYHGGQRSLLLHMERTLGKLHVHRRDPLDLHALHALGQERNIVSFFEGLYALVGNWLTRVTGVQPPASYNYVDQARHYILTHLDRPLSLEQIADQLQISAGHLSRLFKEYLGEGFIEYLTRVRMERMCEHLIHGDAPVQKIAEAVGFINVSYCIRLFKNTYGMTPRQFRLTRREA